MSGMQYEQIPYVDKKVSRIFYGTAAEPFMSGRDASELLDAVLDMGINTIDTARMYGLAEKSIGDWMEKRGNRDQVVLLSKCAHPTPEGVKRVSDKEIREDFAISSGYLKTEYIDMYLLHRDDPKVEAGEIVEILNAMHEEGKIGAFGGSNWTHHRIEAANEYAYKHDMIPFTLSSPNFGLAEQACDPWGGGCVTISGPDNQEARDWYAKADIPVIAYSSLAHGMFSGRVKSSAPEKAGEGMDAVAMRAYGTKNNFERLRRCEELAAKKGCTVPQIAMAWIYNQPLHTFAVVSSSKASRMQQNIDALNIKLTKEEVLFLDLRA